MSTPRFYCPDLHAGELTLSEAESRHALQSLRLRPGDELELFDGQGHVARGVLQPPPPADERRKVSRQARAVVQAIHDVEQPSHALTLIVAGCKGSRLDWLVEKCTELGVGRLLLTEFERSVVHTRDRHVTKLTRTTIEACKQCGRSWLPEIVAGAKLPDVLRQRGDAPLVYAHLGDNTPSLTKYLTGVKELPDDLGVVVGPEGGLSANEVELLAKVGQPVRLARHVLRIETAAIAAAATWAAHACRYDSPTS